ncbi:MAG: ribonuclease P protein component 4 [Thermoplasmata archaeon]
MVSRSGKRSKEDIKLAMERIFSLFETSKKFYEQGWLDHARRSLYLARKIGMRYNVRLPAVIKRAFCKHCYTLFVPGKNARVRVKKGRIIVTCLNCNHVFRYPYMKEKHARKHAKIE